jgi:hypothetical protein
MMGQALPFSPSHMVDAMSQPRLRTRLAGLPPWAARVVLAAVPAAILGCLWVVFTTEVTVKDDKTKKDVTYKAMLPTEPGPAAGDNPPLLPAAFKYSFSDDKFYAKVVEGVRHGEWYYDVLPRLFPDFQYTPFSVFNYRTPTYAWIIGLLPGGVGRLVLAGIGLAGLGMTAVALARLHGPALAAAGTFLILGGLGWCFIEPGRVYLFAEQWAGALIALSVAAYALERWPIGFAAGLAALFFRELSAIYCLLALALAWWQTRRRETVAWLAGFAAYGAFLTFHVQQVLPRLPSGSGASASTWIQFGGVTFLLETGLANFFTVLVLPWWFVAITLPLGLLGLASWPGAMGTRCLLTVLGYLAAFAVVGQWFNSCWGLLYAPLLTMGLAWIPFAFCDLWNAAKPTPAATTAAAPS